MKGTEPPTSFLKINFFIFISNKTCLKENPERARNLQSIIFASDIDLKDLEPNFFIGKSIHISIITPPQKSVPKGRRPKGLSLLRNYAEDKL